MTDDDEKRLAEIRSGYASTNGRVAFLLRLLDEAMPVVKAAIVWRDHTASPQADEDSVSALYRHREAKYWLRKVIGEYGGRT